jgi:radical SAM superfamily enzyme YgiQ (UPF0313 family)
MRVLLVSPNLESLPDPVFPLGLAYITAVLKKQGTSAFQPHMVALSLRNLDNVSYPNYVSYLPFYRQVVQTIRKQSKTPIVVGGSGFSLVPGPLLEFLGADVGIVGEGESSFLSFLDRFDRRKVDTQPLKPEVIHEQPAIVESLDALPFPDRSEFDNEAGRSHEIARSETCLR